MTAQLMLDYKGLAYERVDILPGLHRFTLRVRGFKKGYTPALQRDRDRVQGSRAIARYLDGLQPEPVLFPLEREEREAVEEAERFGEEVLQYLARRLVIGAARRTATEIDFAYGADPNGLPARLMRRRQITFAFMKLDYGAHDPVLRADLIALPQVLDRVDAWIADGVLGGPQPNAADFQIATSIRLLMELDDLGPQLDGRPAVTLAERLAPRHPLRIERVFQSEWLVPAVRAPERSRIPSGGNHR